MSIKEKGGFTGVKELIRGALKEFKADEIFKVPPIWEKWESLVGPAIASKTHPDYVQGRTLIVSVANSVWMQELEMQKKEFVRKIGEMNLPFSIEEIRFRLKREAVKIFTDNRSILP